MGSVPVANYEEEELPHDPSEETLTIEARFQPLLMETMTKSKDGFLGVSRLALSGLRNWTTAASPSAAFAARHFRPFLPPPGQELGQPWWIIPGELSVFTGYLSNNRFYPPPPKGKEVRTALGDATSAWSHLGSGHFYRNLDPRTRHPSPSVSLLGPSGPELTNQLGSYCRPRSSSIAC